MSDVQQAVEGLQVTLGNSDIFNWGNILTGIAVVVAGVLTGLGNFYGKRRPSYDEPEPKMTVAGALIDSTHAQALMHALDRNTKALDRCGDVTERSADRVEDATREIQRMTIELARGGRG